MASKLINENLAFVEEQYARFLNDENAVEPEWRDYFNEVGNGERQTAYNAPDFQPRSIFAPKLIPAGVLPADAAATAHAVKQDRVAQLVQAYRWRGHLFAKLDPLGLQQRRKPDIALADFGLSEADLDTEFTAGGLRGTLRELIAHLEETYCRTIGVETAHIEDTRIRDWLRERMEATRNHLDLSRAAQVHLLTKLTDAEIFEHFLQTKFLGLKRFSLEGGESLIPMVDRIVERCARQGVVEMVIGMAHRGRLNLLANVLNMPTRQIFAEFLDEDPNVYLGKGDVKYHLGHSSDREIEGKNIHLSLSFNPSHLEFVDAVVSGRVRAKQDRRLDPNRRKVAALLIHGDAAFAGQGIIAELFNMAELPGYNIGGTIHIIVNNQVGFTTNPTDARSTRYATDVAKMLGIPIFHVNGEDPEAVAQVVNLATDFRLTFNRDVVIDLYCYRKYGHNEGDEPAYTQPLMYQAIAQHPSVREQFVKKLVSMGEITQEQADAIAAERRQKLDDELTETKKGYQRRPPSAMAGLWAQYSGGKDKDCPEVSTAIPKEQLQELAAGLIRVPEGFKVHPKLVKAVIDPRRDMGSGKRPLDWGMAENLAYASLVSQGAAVRITGQDVERGTFSHRHAVMVDATTGAKYAPLANLASGQASFEIRNSPLSETSVLGYEYGYSLDTPDRLVIWEAQFGDFANAAQVIIDQFIVSAEEKWNRLSGLTMLLPHGYEGQGPEHSSARLDRFLNLCAEDNIQVAYPTTPAQIFHLLRRQVVRPLRKPLVVMTPKSLLRHPEAVSSLEELATGSFQRVLMDPAFVSSNDIDEPRDPSKVKRVLLCSGKVFYDLLAERRVRHAHDVAIVRVEQLYPTPLKQISDALSAFKNANEVVWVQEEPRNGGALTHMQNELVRNKVISGPLHYVSRPPSASPATGSQSSHKLEQRRVIEAAFSPL